MFFHKAVIKFPSHTVYIKVDEVKHIHVFKYSNRTCDFDVFTDQNDACDYILAIPNPVQYRVAFPGE